MKFVCLDTRMRRNGEGTSATELKQLSRSVAYDDELTKHITSLAATAAGQPHRKDLDFRTAK